MLKIKNCCTVKPAEPTPTTGICVSDHDQEKPITHAPIVYFYRPSTSNGTPFSFASAVETLKSSLSQVLVHFYPLAGRLHLTAGGRVKLECNSMGAVFYEAESDAELDDFEDFRPTPRLRSLIPSVDYTAPLEQLPLLMVQLTEFRCGGICLGLGMSHIMADGTSGFHFISEWARLARGEPIDNPPFLDRTVLLAREPPSPSPLFRHDRFDVPPCLIGQSDDREERKKATEVTMLRLSKTQVEKLKKTSNESRPTHTRAYSRYEAVAGHLWRCASKARGHPHEQITKLRFAVDFRNRMRPPLPKGYFGNAIAAVMATSRAGELMTKPLGYASGKIREVVEMVTDEYVRSDIDFAKIQPDLMPFRTFHTAGPAQGAFYGNPNFEVTSWLGLPMHRNDFGWGKEIHAGPGSLAYDGKCFLFPGSDADGSLVVAMRLQEAHMDAFKKFFYEHLC